MSIRWVVTIGLAACSFTPPGATSDDEPRPDGSVVDDDPDAGITPIAPCATPDGSGLVLCLEFEDGVEDGRLDDSAPAARHATTSGLVTATRTVPAMSKAVRVMPDSVVRVADEPALDLEAGYTIAMWIRPAREPDQGQVLGLVDRELQYAMLIGTSSLLGAIENRCVHTDVGFEYTEVLPLDEWSFLACTWDGTTLCASRWTSTTSNERFCRGMAPPRATGAQGLSIGHLSEGGTPHSRFDGDLDSLQIYDRGMTEAQLCSLIGQPANCLGL